MKVDLPKIEKKWQKRWGKARLYEVKDTVKEKRLTQLDVIQGAIEEKTRGMKHTLRSTADGDEEGRQLRESEKENFYHLVMFPYPSGDLHIGHWYNFGPADTYARFKRMRGFNVLSPIGFDAFGLPAENAAIKRKLHPAKWTFKNIETMREQLKSMGTMYDWRREVITCQPEYYKWTQWMFLQLFNAGLAERKKIYANWCPKDKTVLANEQVVDGRCERCDAQVIQKQIDQWVFLITRYAKRLLDDLADVDWPERTKTMQRNWLGQSEGLEEYWQVEGMDLKLSTFTTWPHTSYGATFLAIAPEHDIINKLVKGTAHETGAREFTEKIQKQKIIDRTNEKKEKEGYFTGRYAINHLTGWKMPVYIANFAIMEYGTGIVKGCPAHDQRDFSFAKKYNLDIKVVVTPKGRELNAQELTEAYVEHGVMINASRFDGLDDAKAKIEIADYIVGQGNGKKVTRYKLRDWIVSRQRYWGAPIPIIYCPSCGTVPLPEKDLPVLLPDLKNFEPAGNGKSPLAKSDEFLHTICPKCGAKAERETDTMDTFVDSSWYFLRYTDPQNKKIFAAKEKMQKWLPVNIYIGGAEHSVLHLLYARFLTKALYDMEHLWFREPFMKLRHQGIILGPDGQKMSKSRGNVIDPDKLVAQYGGDVVRMYLMFMGPYNDGGPWNPGGINGIDRFLERIYRVVAKNEKRKVKNDNVKLQSLLHKTIKKVGEDLEELKFNTAISALMVLVNEMQTAQCEKKDYEALVRLLAPFAPHLAEELWFKLGHKTSSVHKESFPEFDEALIKDEIVTIVIQINGKMRAKIEVNQDASESEVKDIALKEKNLQSWLQGKEINEFGSRRLEIKKTIFVQNRLLNLVV